jgi:hypothetical protein
VFLPSSSTLARTSGELGQSRSSYKVRQPSSLLSAFCDRGLIIRPFPRTIVGVDYLSKSTCRIGKDTQEILIESESCTLSSSDLCLYLTSSPSFFYFLYLLPPPLLPPTPSPSTTLSLLFLPHQQTNASPSTAATSAPPSAGPAIPNVTASTLFLSCASPSVQLCLSATSCRQRGGCSRCRRGLGRSRYHSN